MDENNKPPTGVSEAEYQAISAELDRRFEIALNLMPAHIRLDAAASNISSLELRSLLLNELLANTEVWEAILTADCTQRQPGQQARKAKRRRHGRNGGTRAKRLERLAKEWDDFPQPAGSGGRGKKLAAFEVDRAALLAALHIHASGQALLNAISRGHAIGRQRENLRSLVGLQRPGLTLGKRTLARNAIKRYRRAAAVDGDISSDQALQLEMMRNSRIGGVTGVLETPPIPGLSGFVTKSSPE